METMPRFLVLSIWALGAASAVLLAQASADPRERIKTLRDYARAANVDSRQKAASIGAYVRDPDVTVQRAAVEELGRVGSAESLAPLAAATASSDELVQLGAANALVEFYYPGYIKRGLASMKARLLPDDSERIPAHVEVQPEVIAALGKLAETGASVTVKAGAARGLGVLRGQAALPQLLQALRSKDTRVLYESLVAIKKIGDRSVGPQLTYLLRDLDEDVLLAAISANGYLQNPEAAPRLRELAVDPRRRVRPAALSALAQRPDPADRPLFTAKLEDPDAATRTSATEGLARLRQTSDASRMGQLFEREKKMDARLAAAFGEVLLGNRSLGEFAPLRYLANTLNSALWAGVAEGYLEELAREAVNRKAILSLLPVMSREEKTRAVGVLGRTGAADVEDTLVALSRDADVAVGQAAAQALRTLRTQPR
jgi:HEAT repeat protein